MTRSAPQAVRPAPKGAAFGEKGHARTLNRLSWFHVQAMKADKPRLSACTSGSAIPPPFRVQLLLASHRWSLVRSECESLAK